MDLILILGAGRHTRWAGQIPKQCIQVEGMPLIARTLQQVKRVWHTSTPVAIVTYSQELWSACASIPQGATAIPVQPLYSRYVCGTILSTMYMWPEFDRIVVLLGDVAYSPELLQWIYNDGLPLHIRFYGSRAERWAVMWYHEYTRAVIEVMIKSINAIWHQDALDELATPYRILAKHPIRQPHEQFDGLYKIWDHDYVADFDTIEEYQKWMKHNPWAQ